MAAAEIVMVRKCFEVIFFWPVDTGMFFTYARCKVIVPHLNGIMFDHIKYMLCIIEGLLEYMCLLKLNMASVTN